MISIIIPTLNEAKLIESTLKQFNKSFKKSNDFEIILSDNGSSDKTISIAKQFSCKIIENVNSNKNISLTRNNGYKYCNGEILVFLDADIFIENTNIFLKRLIKEFSDKNLVACSPKIFVYPNQEKIIDKLVSRIHSFLCIIPNKIGIGYARGGCQIIRRSAFKKIGGYNEKLIAGEDVDVFQRLGKLGHTKILSDFIVYESPRRYRAKGYFNVLSIWFVNYLYAVFFKKSFSSQWEEIR